MNNEWVACFCEISTHFKGGGASSQMKRQQHNTLGLVKGHHVKHEEGDNGFMESLAHYCNSHRKTTDR